jgi:hypothetical protein
MLVTGTKTLRENVTRVGRAKESVSKGAVTISAVLTSSSDIKAKPFLPLHDRGNI